MKTRNKWRAVGCAFALVICGSLALAGNVLAMVVAGALCVGIVVRAEHDTNTNGGK